MKEMPMTEEQSRIKAEYGLDVTFVTFIDEKILEDKQLRELQKSFETVIERNDNKKLILDFINVKFMTSAFLGLLIRIHKKVCELDGQIQLCNVDPNIRRVFEITQLTKIFDIT
jgi:anti-anti-sigma factor